MKNNRGPKSLLNEATKQSIKEFFGIDPDCEIFSPTIDYAFKRIFTADEERSKIALIDFLNSVFEFESENSIVDLTVVNPQIPVDLEQRKKSIFDIRAKYNNGEQVIIEMQMGKEYDFKKRSQFIVSKAYVSQPIAGLDYDALKKCYLICITNFKVFQEKEDFVSEYRMRDKAGEELTNDQTIIFLELPKLEGIINKTVAEMTNLEMWVVFFRYVTDKSKRDMLNSILNRKEGIKMAATVLDEISRSEQERIQYENELIAELDANTRFKKARIEGLAEGLAEGEKKALFNVARRMKEKAIEISEIVDFTGLTEDEINNL